MKVFLTLVICLLFSSTSLSQNLEWLNSVRGDSKDLTVDTENNSYLLGKFPGFGLGIFLTDTTTLVKYNEIGQFSWVKNIPYEILAIEAEEKTCDLYVVARTSKAIKIGNDDFAAPKWGHSSILIKTDSAFNIKWTRLLSDSSVLEAAKIAVTRSTLVLRLYISEGISFKGKHYNRPINPFAHLPTEKKLTVFLNLEKNKGGSSNEWITSYYTKRGSTTTKDISIDALGNIYCGFINPKDSLFINNNFYNLITNHIIKLSAKTGVLDRIIEISTLHHLADITVLPSGKIFVSGWFENNFNYKGVSYTDTNRLFTSILILLENNGNPIWAIKDDDAMVKSGFAYFPHTKYRNDNIYISGFIQHGNTSIGGIPLEANNNIHTSMTFGKIDTLGNILWAFVIKQPPNSLSFAYSRDLVIDYSGNPIFSGFLNNNITVLDSFVTIPNSLGSHTILFKLSDYVIQRGNVYPGPYCAGDTIEIPYTKIGKFKPDNEFIAQLSDDNGEFIGNERELGRLKDSTNGIIKGLLPLFNVNTSGNYRIRVLATKPIVQSYYRQDTLRLLIYSRDSANAGNDTIICQGQAIPLTTTGGSKWDWSPAASLDDSTLFKPLASPKVDTRYRIIISDSSGCGDTDTDYVWVRLRQPLKANAPFTDSTICRGQFVKLYASGSGGDSLNYSINWYERRATGDIALNNNTDSIQITSTQNPKTYFAILQDGCTIKPDSQFYNIKTLQPLAVSIHNSKNTNAEISDSLLCYNAPLKLYAKAQGGKITTHKLKWYGINFFVDSDSLQLTPAKPNAYYVILNDNCTARPDTAFVTITQRAPLSLNINANDNLCLHDTVKLSATSSGGDTSKHQFIWRAANTGWATNQQNTIHIPNSTTTYIATISDNCSPTVSDSIKVNIHPIPTPQFTFNNNYGCPPLLVEYQDKSKGNIGANNRWVVDNGLETNNANASKLFNKSAITTAKLIITNQFGCIDSIIKSEQVKVFDKPRAQFVANPSRLEVGEPITFTSTSREAIKYQWDLGDGILSYDEGTVKRAFYNEGEQTITLVAENSLGCKDTAYKTIRIFDKVYCSIPNAFTPNGDEHNNVFSPACEGINDYTLTIYSRWGQVIHQSRNGAWDGTYADKPVPEGVYMYKIHLHAQSKNKSMVYGSVNVIR